MDVWPWGQRSNLTAEALPGRTVRIARSAPPPSVTGLLSPAYKHQRPVANPFVTRYENVKLHLSLGTSAKRANYRYDFPGKTQDM